MVKGPRGPHGKEQQIIENRMWTKGLFIGPGPD